MHRRKAGKLLAATVAAAVLATAAPGQGKPSDKWRAHNAASYLVRFQKSDGSVTGFSAVGSTADFVLALAAARRGPRAIDDAIGYLRGQVSAGVVTGMGSKAKVVLAVVAAGGDPRAFGGHDLVGEIEASQQPSGEYGDGSDFLGVSDHALAMLALEASGAQPTAGAVRWLVSAQCPDGGWQFDEPHDPRTDNRHCRAKDPNAGDFSTSDTNITSYAVQALVASGRRYHLGARPFSYFWQARDRHMHGWVYSATKVCGKRITKGCFLTDANSTALVIQAYLAAGKKIPRGSMLALRSLQYPRLCGKAGGAFAFTWKKRNGRLHRDPSRKDAVIGGESNATNVGATIGAVPALMRQALPSKKRVVTDPVPQKRPCRSR
jgi:hypothetical protein